MATEFLSDIVSIRERARRHMLDMIREDLVAERVAIESYGEG